MGESFINPAEDLCTKLQTPPNSRDSLLLIGRESRVAKPCSLLGIQEGVYGSRAKPPSTEQILRPTATHMGPYDPGGCTWSDVGNDDLN